MSKQEIRHAYAAGDGERIRIEHVTITTEIAHVPASSSTLSAALHATISGRRKCKERRTGSSSRPAEWAPGFWRTTSPNHVI